MRKQYSNLSKKDEINLLSEELDPREMYILGFLNGIDRKAMKELGKRGMWDIPTY